jgi:hypothetical protein
MAALVQPSACVHHALVTALDLEMPVPPVIEEASHNDGKEDSSTEVLPFFPV